MTEVAPEFNQLHLIIVEGYSEDFNFYKLHVPDASVLDSIPEDIIYGDYERDPLRYWGPFKQPDISKVIAFCYFDSTIFMVYQNRERGVKYLRRFNTQFERKLESKKDYRERDRVLDDLQLEEEANMSQTSNYLILSYLNKVEFIKSGASQSRVDVFKTMESEHLESNFNLLDFFEG